MHHFAIIPAYPAKVVVYWSKKFHDREYFQHRSFLEFIEKLRKDPSSFRVIRLSPTGPMTKAKHSRSA